MPFATSLRGLGPRETAGRLAQRVRHHGTCVARFRRGGVLMRDDERIAARVSEALERDPRIRICERPLWVGIAEALLTIEGEVAEIASKRRAVAHAAALGESFRILDRVQVLPAERMEDGMIRDHVRDAFVGEPVFAECSIRASHRGHVETVRDLFTDAVGALDVEVGEGVVTLRGSVPSLAHKRMAEALVWWVPGTRDVQNDLEVSPAEEDNDDELTDAVRLVLEKEPFVDADQIRIRTSGGQVIVTGVLASDEQRRIVEKDAWCVPGVREVIDRIELASATRGA
jgi:osmotically-inducible protein OsmY